METVSQFIERLANKAGVKSDDPNLINILSSAELSKITVPAELVAGIDNQLLSLNQAKDNHPALKRLYHAQALNAFDTRMAEVIENSGLSADQVADLKAEVNTYSRFEKLQEALKTSHETALKTAGQGADKSALKTQVDELLNTIKAKETDYNAKIAQLNEQRQKDRVGYEIKNMLGGVKTVFDELPSQAKQAALDTLINQALSNREASFTFDEDGQLTLRGKDGSVVVGANHTKYTPQNFIEETLAQNKVIKVAETTPPQATQTNGQTVKGANPANSGINKTNIAANLEMLKAFEENSAA